MGVLAEHDLGDPLPVNITATNTVSTDVVESGRGENV